MIIILWQTFVLGIIIIIQKKSLKNNNQLLIIYLFRRFSIKLIVIFRYSQFHKTIPRSSLHIHWISVRFNEMGDMTYSGWRQNWPLPFPTPIPLSLYSIQPLMHDQPPFISCLYSQITLRNYICTKFTIRTSKLRNQ